MFLALKTDRICKENESNLDDLLLRIAEGDSAAMEQLYFHTSSSIYSFAFSILKNSHDAEDALHDCYVIIWHSAATYSPQGKPRAWLLTITRNLCLQQLREHRKRADSPQEEWESYLGTKDSLSLEDRSVLQSCLAYLSDEEQQIVTLHAVSGFKHREIASLLELPLSTVLSKYNRAIKKLRQYLQ